MKIERRDFVKLLSSGVVSLVTTGPGLATAAPAVVLEPQIERFLGVAKSPSATVVRSVVFEPKNGGVARACKLLDAVVPVLLDELGPVRDGMMRRVDVLWTHGEGHSQWYVGMGPEPDGSTYERVVDLTIGVLRERIGHAVEETGEPARQWALRILEGMAYDD